MINPNLLKNEEGLQLLKKTLHNRQIKDSESVPLLATLERLAKKRVDVLSHLENKQHKKKELVKKINVLLSQDQNDELATQKKYAKELSVEIQHIEEKKYILIQC